MHTATLLAHFWILLAVLGGLGGMAFVLGLRSAT